jgi:Activator of Hsp90 ATPase homolog 1-like protein
MIKNSKTNSYKLIQGMLTCIFILCGASIFSQDTLKIKKMKTTDFTTAIVVDQTPKQVFDAINNVRGWWSEEIEGSTNKLNAAFNYHFEDMHRCKIKIIEFVPNEKVVWLVEDNYFKFTKDKSEWTGTKIVFEIAEKDNKTELHFTHLGLVPEYECYNVCRDGWTNYIQNSLHSLVTTGKGQPNATGKPQTKTEKKLRAEHK